MASFIYSVRTTQKDANADVMVRIRFSAYVEGKKVDTYAQSGVKIPKKAWDDKKAAIKSAFTSTANSANEGKTLDNLQNDLNEIKAFVFQRYNMLGEGRISTQWLEGIITEYWDIRRQIVEDERQVKEALANKETFNHKQIHQRNRERSTSYQQEYQIQDRNRQSSKSVNGSICKLPKSDKMPT